MKTIRCGKCKKVYEYDGLPPKYCPECYLREEESYKVVREYIKGHQGATIYEVSEAVDVPRAKILQYLREERLEISPQSTTFLKCRGCGQIINTGVYCDLCKKRYGSSTAKIIGKVAIEDAEMHYAPNRKNDDNGKAVVKKEGQTSSNLYKK